MKADTSEKEETDQLKKKVTEIPLRNLLTDDTLDMDIEKDITINKDQFMGHYITSSEPRRIGSTFAFNYVQGEPRIVIGPHCSISLI